MYGPRIMGASHPNWISLARAAAILDESEESLRKKLMRASRKACDGVVEATLDGIRARKFGRNWKVLLSPRWTEGAGP